MGEAIGAVLPSAVGVAISPLPIVAAILMLFTPKARSNGPAFAAGWVVGMAIVIAIVLLLADPADVSSSGGEPSTTSSVLQLALGALLLFFAYRQWQARPQEGETRTMPKWMQSIDRITPAKAFGFGALMSGVNPKNLLLDVAAATSIAQLDISTGSQIVAALVFIVVASVTVGGVVIWYLAAGKRAEAKLADMKEWLLTHNAAVMAVLLLVFGAVEVGKGIAGLSA